MESTLSERGLRLLVQDRLRAGATLYELARERMVKQITEAGIAVGRALAGGHKVLLFGNGGSAADAQHIAAEFVGRVKRERQPLPALALTTDTSTLTSIANDYGFDAVFSRQVAALGEPGDVAIAISTSGNSPNVVSGAVTARQKGISVIALTGGSGGRLAQIADIPLVVPAQATARIQEVHAAVGHLICEIAELFLEANAAIVSGDAGLDDLNKVVPLETLMLLRPMWKREGARVVWTNGCFDLLHVGHLRTLATARMLGDILVVGVNSDRSVRALKGPGRPIVPEKERAEIVAALEFVDYVTIFDDVTPDSVLAKLQPDVHVKGEEYRPPLGKPIPEMATVLAYGGKVEFVPMVGNHSTSLLIERIRGSVGNVDES